MFNIGGAELLVILLLGLLVLGPERLPKAMGQVGQWVAKMRKLSSGFQDEIRRAMDPDDAPFRPGEQTMRPANVADEVRVVGADRDEDVIDAEVVEDDPSHMAIDDEPVESTDVAPPSDTTAPDTTAETTAPIGVADDTGTVIPLRGRDDGDARAAG